MQWRSGWFPNDRTTTPGRLFIFWPTYQSIPDSSVVWILIMLRLKYDREAISKPREKFGVLRRQSGSVSHPRSEPGNKICQSALQAAAYLVSLATQMTDVTVYVLRLALPPAAIALVCFVRPSGKIFPSTCVQYNLSTIDCPDLPSVYQRVFKRVFRYL